MPEQDAANPEPVQPVSVDVSFQMPNLNPRKLRYAIMENGAVIAAFHSEADRAVFVAASRPPEAVPGALTEAELGALADWPEVHGEEARRAAAEIRRLRARNAAYEALETPLAWTKESPTKPGWYWFTNEFCTTPEPVHVEDVGLDDLTMIGVGMEDRCPLTQLPPSEWSGPLVPPGEKR